MDENARRLIEGVLDGDPEGVNSSATALGNETAYRVMTGAFIAAVFRQFPENASSADVAAYVTQLRKRLHNGADLKPLPTEAAIRSVLGEPELRRGLSTDDVMAAYAAVIFAVSKDHNLSGLARDAYIEEVLTAAR